MSHSESGPEQQGDVSRETDPLGTAPEVVSWFGAAYDQVVAFHEKLVGEGVLRGLIGPRELPRLWDRHLINSGALAQFLPASGTLLDVGSGGGFPGVIIAAQLPHLQVTLLEPMERRIIWLNEVVSELGLTNVEVLRGRAEELHGKRTFDAVTARAVAPMDKLSRWTLPLVKPGGALYAMKGERAGIELEDAKYVIKALGGDAGEVLAGHTIDQIPVTNIVKVVKVKGAKK